MKKIILIIFLLSSCGKPDNGILPFGNNFINKVQFDSIKGEYTFAGYVVSKTAGSEKVTLSIKGQSENSYYLGGSSYVNQYGGNFILNEKMGTVDVKELVTTEMASIDPQLNAAEAEYYQNLQNTKKFTLEGNILKLYDTEPATEIMIFNKIN